MRVMTRGSALVCLLAAMALTGANVPVGKTIVVEVPVYVFLFFRFALAALALALIVRGEEGPRLLEMKLVQARDLVLTGMIGMIGFTVFLFEGLTRTAASDAGIITATLPAVAAVLSVLILRERINWRGIASIGLAVAGVAVIQVDGGGGGVRTLVGNSLVVGAVLCEAIFVILSKRLVPPFRPIRLALGANLVGLVLSLPLAVAQGTHFDPLSVRPMIWALGAWYALSSSVFVLLLWYRGLPRVEGSIASLTSSAIPVTALLVSAVALGEVISPARIVGATLVIVAIAIGTTAGRDRTQS